MSIDSSLTSYIVSSNRSSMCNRSVPNSSDELIFVKRRALDGPFLDKNTGFRRAHSRAKFMFLIFFFLSQCQN